MRSTADAVSVEAEDSATQTGEDVGQSADGENVENDGTSGEVKPKTPLDPKRIVGLRWKSPPYRFGSASGRWPFNCHPGRKPRLSQ